MFWSKSKRDIKELLEKNLAIQSRMQMRIDACIDRINMVHARIGDIQAELKSTVDQRMYEIKTQVLKDEYLRKYRKTKGVRQVAKHPGSHKPRGKSTKKGSSRKSSKGGKKR